MDTTKRKAKRKLSNIDFTQEGCHIAIVSDEQGGPANGADYALVMKSTAQFSDEFIEKMQQVKVTMELPDFLRRFFNMYYEDAEILSRMMGYVPPETPEEEYEAVDSYEDYIESRLEAFEVIKTLHEAQDLTKALSNLDEESYMALLQDQERLEKVFKKLDKNSADPVNKQEEQKGSTEVNSEVGADTEAEAIAKAENPTEKFVLYKQNGAGGWEPTNVKANFKVVTLTKAENKIEVNTEETMTDKSKDTQEQDVTVEVVEKSVFEALEKAAKQTEADKEALEKAINAQKEELTKALALVEQFQAEKKEALNKARFASVKEAVKDEAKAEVLFKAANLIEDQKVFDEVVDVLKQLTNAVEETDMFVEKGADVEGEGAEVKKESAVAAHIKKQAAKAK